MLPATRILTFKRSHNKKEKRQKKLKDRPEIKISSREREKRCEISVAISFEDSLTTKS